MTQPGPTPPNWHQPQPDNSTRALKLSGAALIWTIIAVIVGCVGVPLLCCSGTFIAGVVGDPSVTPTP